MSSKALLNRMEGLVRNGNLKLDIEIETADGKQEVISLTPVELLVDA